jgi:hypothetical protein
VKDQPLAEIVPRETVHASIHQINACAMTINTAAMGAWFKRGGG